MTATGTRSKKNDSKPAGLTLDGLRKLKKPVSRTIYIAGDSDAAVRLGKAQEELTQCQNFCKLRPLDEEAMVRLEKAKTQYEETYEEVKPTLIPFTFNAMGSVAYDEFTKAHTLEPEEWEEFYKLHPEMTDEDKQNMGPWHPEKFPRALLTRCMVAPVKCENDEEAEAFLAWLDGPDWNGQEIAQLYITAMEVNNSRQVVELGKGFL